jgi:ribosome-associated protein
MSEVSTVPEPTVKLCNAILGCLEDAKGQDIKPMNVTELTSVADYMILVTGTSSRHVRSLATNTMNSMREQGCKVTGVEGEDTGEWVLIDFGDVIVHVMQSEVRSFYDLESLWQSNFSKTLTSEQ